MEMVLFEHQKPHFANVKRILSEWYAYLDTSQTGTGKTIIAIETAKELNLPMIVVGEVSTKGMWEQTCRKHGADLLQFLSYAKLRGKNDYLIKGEEFQVSPYGEKVLRDGVLLVYDECHNLKNRSLQSEAACCLSSWIVANSIHSRIACLSATPIDKKGQVLSLMRIMGIVLNSKLYEYNQSTEEYILTGLEELANMARLLSPIDAQEIMPEHITKANASHVAYQLFKEVIKPRLSSAISNVLILPDKDIANGYYRIEEPADREKLEAGVNSLRKLVRMRGDEAELISTGGNWSRLTEAMMTIEKAKVGTMVRLARQTLAIPHTKVILYFNYLDPIAEAEYALRDYDPLVMTGSSKDRDRIISAFNRPDDTSRLLIANTRVAGTGINLDDTHGGYPRHIFMIPTYNFIDLHQATGRIHRATTKSTATVRLVYGAVEGTEKCLEHVILAALARKSMVTRGAVNDETVVYPGEYPIYREPLD